MKTYILIFITLLTITSSLAQTMGINYKAVIKDDTGVIVANQTIDVRFNILDDALSSDYQETHTVTTDANGIIILNIGEGTVVNGSYTFIDWGSNAYQLQTEIDIEQDGSFVDLGITGFKAVPYALQAKSIVPESIEIDDLKDCKSDNESQFPSIFIGRLAGLNNQGNRNNLGFGANSLESNTSGLSNIGIGRFAGEFSSTGDYNVFLGRKAGSGNVSGSNNISIGQSARGSSSGDYNISIGKGSGYFSAEGNTNCIIIGTEAGNYFRDRGSHKLYIDSSTTNSSDANKPLIYGEFDNDILGFNGDVAIGHDAPLAALHVKKNGATNTQTIVAVLEAATSNRPTLLFSETADATQNVGMSLEYNGEGANDNKMVFNSTQNTPLFELENSGDFNVLNGDISIKHGAGDTALRMADFNGDLDRVLLRQTSTNDVFVGDIDNNGGNLIIRAGGINVLHAKSTGLIGIGTSAPTRQLQLSTNSAGKPGSATWDVTSDRRLKKDITPFNDGLETLQNIDPVWFTYNGLAGMPIETNVGTIAQDLQKVAPYLIKDWNYTDDKGRTENYLGVNYGPLTFIMVNAIKEQAQEIEILKKTYEDKIKALEARILRLEN